MNKKEILALASAIAAALSQPFSEGFNFHKNVTVAGTAERVTDQNTPIRAMSIKAKRTNTGYIYIGFDDQGLTSSTNGRELEPKASERIPIDNANKVWLDASVSGEGVEIILYR